MKKLLIPTLIATAIAGLVAIPAQAKQPNTTVATPNVATQTTSEQAQRPTFDVRTKELRIPCLEVKGVVAQGEVVADNKYDVVMKQRGQSSNWEITFVNPGCAGDMPAEDAPPVETPTETPDETTETTDSTAE